MESLVPIAISPHLPPGIQNDGSDNREKCGKCGMYAVTALGRCGHLVMCGSCHKRKTDCPDCGASWKTLRLIA
jgi:hypothetical protein